MSVGSHLSSPRGDEELSCGDCPFHPGDPLLVVPHLDMLWHLEQGRWKQDLCRGAALLLGGWLVGLEGTSRSGDVLGGGSR